MDEDLTFGASVWGLATPSTPSVPLPAFTVPPDTNVVEEEDFDDFGSPTNDKIHADDADDDFGDFGNFDDTEITAPADFGESLDDFKDPVYPVAGPSTYANWTPLNFDSIPDRKKLVEELDVILAPVWADVNVSEILTDEPIREREGVSQILVTEESRGLYAKLIQSPPPTKPPNWTRSKIRRQHLIALGIPVNLDEMLPQSHARPLPPLQITTRPMSAPPGPRPSRGGSNPSSTVASRASSPSKLSRQVLQTKFGPKPDLDESKINTLLDVGSQSLSLQPLHVLQRMLTDIHTQTANTSALLTYLLQMRDSLQQDSETYNGLIAELVGEAQKIKTGKSVKTPVRRGSGMV